MPMRNVLIINGHQKYEKLAEGKLTSAYVNIAQKFLQDSGFEVKITNVDKSYDIEEEVEKFSWAYYFILQFPVYWMGLPWMAKKYIDEVFSAGKGKSTFKNDGRLPNDTNTHYGTGGLMGSKKYMLSMTYNCPESEFSNPEGFFKGSSVDDANIAIHKIFQFCGATKMQSFVAFDVYRGNLDILEEKAKYTNILSKNFL